MFLIYQNIIKSISSIFAFLIFTISFFLLQLSISFINITPIEFLIKPFLVNKIDGYDNSFSEAVLYIDTDSSQTANIFAAPYNFWFSGQLVSRSPIGHAGLNAVT